MTQEELNKILKQGEGTRIEFKEAQTKLPSTLYETIVAFSNTDGGTIVLGADDDGKLMGLSDEHIKTYTDQLAVSLNNRNCLNPPFLITPIVVTLSAGTVMVLQVPASSQVHDHARKIFIRNADADLNITDNQQMVSDLYLRKREYFSESQIYPHLEQEELSKELFDRARALIRGYQPTHPWVAASNEEILRMSSLWRKDYKTGEAGLTLAAVLIFGKDEVIQSILPAYKVEALVRKENLDRYDDRITLRTNLIDTYLRLMSFVKKHVAEKFYIENGQRKDLRELIFREVIGNLVVHREYTSAHSTDLVIHADKAIATNPNKPLFHGPIDPDSFNPYPKNPNIRKFFTAFGWTDEIGSGIRNTNKYLSIYTPGAKPFFYENDLFRTEIPLVAITLAPFTNKLLKWLDLPATEAEHVREGLASVNIHALGKEASWQQVVMHLVPGWNQIGTRLNLLKWPKKQPLEQESLEKVPGWDQEGTRVVHNKVRYYISILALTTQAIKLEGLMEALDYKNRKTFRDNYLNPLQEAELIQKTNPENPSDPEQKYRITEKGKLFLAAKKEI